MPSGLMPSLVVGHRYPDLIRNTPNLIGYWRFRETSGTVLHDELGLVNGVYGASPGLGRGTPINGGSAAMFNGTSQYVTIAKDLSAYSAISFSFWMWWDAYVGNDDLAMEYTANANSAAGFYLDPNNSGDTTFTVKMGTDWDDAFPRPSAARWHHYLFGMNRATPLTTVSIDGRPQTLTTGTHTSAAGNFANATLNVMCRNAASLFGAGQMSELALFGGRILTTNDAATQYNVGLGR